MASCFECGKNIPTFAYRCPYCRAAISSSHRKANEQDDGYFYTRDPLDNLAPYFDNVLHFVALVTAIVALIYFGVIYLWASGADASGEFTWISAFFLWFAAYMASAFIVSDFVSTPTNREVARQGLSNRPGSKDLRRALLISLLISTPLAAGFFYVCTAIAG